MDLYLSSSFYYIGLFLTGKPKRCLTAYNIFFQQERQRLLDSLPARSGVKSKKAHGKIGFAELGRTISRNWKAVTAEQKEYYYELAKVDKKRYLKEMEEWKPSLAERDSPAEVSVDGSEITSGATEMPVTTGSILIQDDPVPTSAPPVPVPVQWESSQWSSQEIMHTMRTEDLVDFAVGNTSSFIFDTTVPVRAPAPVNSERENILTPHERIEAAALAHTLDEDCRNFLAFAFC